MKRIKKKQSFEKWSVLPQTLCQVRRTEALNTCVHVHSWSFWTGLSPPHLKFSVINPIISTDASLFPSSEPVRYYDKDTTKPISFYLSSLEELLAWTPNVEDGFNVALGPPECRQPPLSSRRPRTLMCHDMMGGYLDDK